MILIRANSTKQAVGHRSRLGPGQIASVERVVECSQGCAISAHDFITHGAERRRWEEVDTPRWILEIKSGIKWPLKFNQVPEYPVQRMGNRPQIPSATRPLTWVVQNPLAQKR